MVFNVTTGSLGLSIFEGEKEEKRMYLSSWAFMNDEKTENTGLGH